MTARNDNGMGKNSTIHQKGSSKRMKRMNRYAGPSATHYILEFSTRCCQQSGGVESLAMASLAFTIHTRARQTLWMIGCVLVALGVLVKSLQMTIA